MARPPRFQDYNHKPRSAQSVRADPAYYRACGLGETRPVGSHPGGVSPYGVHDMAGNAAEWTGDWYRSDYYANSPAENPPGPDKARPGKNVASRGGSWYSKSTFLRTFHRNHEFAATSTLRNVTMRCAVSP